MLPGCTTALLALPVVRASGRSKGRMTGGTFALRQRRSREGRCGGGLESCFAGSIPAPCSPLSPCNSPDCFRVGRVASAQSRFFGSGRARARVTRAGGSGGAPGCA